MGSTGGGMCEDDRITGVALRLFAEVGYDNVDTRMIADAAGVDARTVAAHGGKSGLYKRIFENFYRRQSTMLDEVEHKYADDQEGQRRLLEEILDFYLDHPYEMAVWQHRGMRDAADLDGLDAYYWNMVFLRHREVVGRAVASRPDFQMLFNLLAGGLRGFLFGGIITGEGELLGPDSREGRRLFREQMHRLLVLVVGAGLVDEAART
ncbi:TetR/AcrR family transcriptional regulator [Actinocorallia sp. API 0066]|uniref:TetR/AcrR family transcriptional regulator n=1 Tax=Actinocorallia sp. API 0066 TaxID=2896846 RepID=UPI001E4CA853|nr:TetR/AcrR family transcriptional regulator [Actinocorallia sp. API 0066]MCD0451556.1 TetR/AcrR family transcriptional regulator [Actinocorallia sp. API 0066]